MMNKAQFFAIFFESVVVFMTIFFFIQYSIIRKKEHLNYALYLLCLSLYYVVAVPEVLFQQSPEQIGNDYFYNLFKRPVQFLSSVFYTGFIIYYLGLKTKSFFLYRFFIYLIWLYILVAFACFVCNYFVITYDNIYYIFSLLLFPLQVFVLVTLFRHKLPYAIYIIWGSLIVVVTSSLTLIYSLYLLKNEPGNLYANAQSYIPVQIGILLDIFLFTIALQKKIADNEKALINAAYAKQRAVLLERERIIADLHDDVGGGLSSIRMMSDLMARPGSAEKNIGFAQKISSTAKDIAQRMHTIIWSLNAENDSLNNFSEYARQYGMSFFENLPVNFKFIGSKFPEDIKLGGVLRKNLFLIFKESLHNIIKHSDASEASVSMTLHNDIFTILVSDNGHGNAIAEPSAIGSGNGLKNMRKRIEEVGGRIFFTATPGMTIQVEIDLKAV